MLQLRRKIKPVFRILAAPKASVPYIRCQLRSRQSTETAHSVEKRKQPGAAFASPRVCVTTTRYPARLNARTAAIDMRYFPSVTIAVFIVFVL